jgi:cyclopropane-fatty-acyl-phospholipid synthase
MRQRPAVQSIDTEHARRSRSPTKFCWPRLLRGLECGRLVVDTPRGRQLVFQGKRQGPQARLTIHNWRCVRRLVTRWDLGFAEAYMAGEWSSPDLVALLQLAAGNAPVAKTLGWLRLPRVGVRLRHTLNRNTKRGSLRNVAAHYDLGNAFYEQWLDAGMTYSSALFSHPGQTLEEAQSAKLDRVLDLLNLTGGERVLEIGCGWGTLVERMAERHECAITAITLSTEQLAFAQRRLHGRQLRGKYDLQRQDYRDLSGPFDRIVSIEMLEAVGEAYWSNYFKKLRQCLRPDGIAVLQVITIDDARFENYRRRPDVIQRYIFPGGMLPTASIIAREIADAGLELLSTEFFGQSYARTLREWRLRFQRARPTIAGLGFDGRFQRIWEYYLAYCEVGFEIGAVNVGLYRLAHAAHK